MVAAVLVLAAAAAGGCKTSSDMQDPPPSGGAEMTESGAIRFRSESSSSSKGGAMRYVTLPFENIVYLPWKLVGGGFKGAADGVSAGFGEGRLPVLGVLFSPINAVAGFVTGGVQGLARSPFLIGPDHSFSYAMSLPTTSPTTIWWYE
jgi:hypothetical protein